MDYTGTTITLYSSQKDIVYQTIKRDGVCYSKPEYVQKKYAESAQIFLTAYNWFSKTATRLVPKPEGAEFPYWAFADLYVVGQSDDGHILKLEVPKDEVILFDMYDWNQIMQMHYMAESEAERKQFYQELEACGIRRNDVMFTNFYPEQKQRILKSWERLFRHHEQILEGSLEGVGSVQAGLWRIKEEWIVE